MFVTPEPHVPPVMAVISPIYTDLFAQKPPETTGKLEYYRGERHRQTDTDTQKQRQRDTEIQRQRYTETER